MAFPKSSDRGTRKGQVAFTLLELLISIALFAIVLGTVYTVYQSTFVTIAGTENSIELANRGRQALQRITADLVNLRFGAGGYLSSQERELQGERSDQLTFVSELHLPLRQEDRYRGNTLIQYEVKEDENGKKSLYRRESILYPGGSDENSARTHLLCRGVRSLAFTFVDEEQEDGTSWQSGEEDLQEVLDSGSVPKLPWLITIDLRLQADDDEQSEVLFKTSVATKVSAGGQQ